MENSVANNVSSSLQVPLLNTPNLLMVGALASISDLAFFLKVTPKHLTYIAYHLDEIYKYSEFEIPKKSGGFRKISAPHIPIKILQKKLSDFFQCCFEEILYLNNVNNKIIHGFIKEKSISTNASLHLNKRYLLNIDIEDFFSSIHFGRVFGYLTKNRNFQFKSDVAKIISALSCYKGVLPQGSPLSPVLSNLIFQPCDIALLNYAKKNSITYTRYADDLTFSSDRPFDKDKLLQDIEECIARYDFKINSKKTRFQSFHERQSVTGITTNKKLNVSKEYYKKVRSLVFCLIKDDDFKLEGKKNEYNIQSKLNVLQGRLSHIDWIDSQEKQKKIKSIKNEKDIVKAHRDLNKRERTLRDFYIYTRFFFDEKALIICEGSTDISHIGMMINFLKKNEEAFFRKEKEKVVQTYEFLKWDSNANRFLSATGGTPSFTSISKRIENPEKFSKIFKGKTTKKKIIYVMDYDETGEKALENLKKTAWIKGNS
ncbi:reverse transcriptase domain-containing protein [Marinomonas posidonica]|uniref:reverse transcriptase domain-containing protein n=1 Tax=Marinomonas posidonica TaxID=936476 RepID=UPI003735F5A1